MREVWIISGVRTPIGSFGKSLKDVSSTQLGVIAAREAIKRAGIEPEKFDDVLVGNCMMRSDEINVARCVSLTAGVPFSTPAATIQRQCSSSMQALAFAAQQIQCGDSDAVLVGGTESMSRVPYALYDMRWGSRMGPRPATDMLTEGLSDPLGHFHMGETAENLAEKYDISREDQDELAFTSHQRAIAAIKSNRFESELVPVPIPQRKGDPVMFTTDEHPRDDVSLEGLASLKPAFRKGGTVTAGNASGLNDGAAAAVVVAAEKAKEWGLKPIARIVTHGIGGVEPELMGYGPVPAMEKALKKAKMDLKDIQLIECNEAFAAQYISVERLLNLDRDITNVNGSGIALGHPVGCTGLRIVVSLVHEMARRDLTVGAATLCVGGGMGMATIIERI
ncbi:MAG: acetyl-CoA C-acetyltransferase [Deltaproteobacteria bacterium]|nr:acetyl-CoA C-acetyltransferase [Deltaproteobacteria bacterium]